MIGIRPHDALQRRQDLRGLRLLLPSGFQRFHGRRFISASANSVAASRSSGKRCATSRMASAYARSSAARSAGGVAACRFASASMFARSRAVTRPARTHGLLDGRVGGLLPLGVRRAVVVRAVRQRDAPVAHRAGRIEAGRFPERAIGLDVVEGVDESQPLVEVGLGLTRGRRNGLVVAPEALQEHGWRGRVTPGLMVGRRLRRAGGESERERSQDRADRTSHLTAPSLPHRKANVPAGVPHGLAAVRGPCARRDSASTDRERDCPSTPAGSPPRRYDCGSRPRPPAVATPVGGWRTRPGAACRAAEQPRIAASTP